MIFGTVNKLTGNYKSNCGFAELIIHLTFMIVIYNLKGAFVLKSVNIIINCKCH